LISLAFLLNFRLGCRPDRNDYGRHADPLRTHRHQSEDERMNQNWPDPVNPGLPVNPDQEGPRLIVNEHGNQCWVWWSPTTGAWSSGSWQGPPILAAERWTYVGAAIAPEAPANLGQTQVHVQPRKR
jgi:hypothetical protein